MPTRQGRSKAKPVSTPAAAFLPAKSRAQAIVVLIDEAASQALRHDALEELWMLRSIWFRRLQHVPTRAENIC
jgi:hypothetical protein